MHDDIVAIEVFPKEQWSAPSHLVLEEQPEKEATEEDDTNDDVEMPARDLKDEVGLFNYNL